MGSSETQYTARFVTPERLERGRTQTIKCAVYRDGAVADVTSGTVSIWNRSGTAIVSAASVSVGVGLPATYAVNAAVLPATLPFEHGWRFEWALLMPDGVTHTFQNDGALVRRRLYPVVTDVDLRQVHSDLNPQATDSIVTSSWNAQEYLDLAWNEIDSRLVSAGNFPNLVTNPSAFKFAHLYRTLGLIFTDLATSAVSESGGRYGVLAEKYDAAFAEAWGRVVQALDYDEDGVVDEKAGAQASVWLSGGRVASGWGA